MTSRARTQKAIGAITPWLVREGDIVWRPLRRWRPVLRAGRLVLLTRHEDVRNVLQRDDAFSVTYGEKMEQVTGEFILGWDDGPEYRREREALRAAAPRDTLPEIARMTGDRAREILAATAWPIDAVGLADEAVGVGLDRYMGLPQVAGRPSRQDARAVFRAVFLAGEDPAVLEAGQAASRRLEARLREAVAAAEADGGPEGTMLARLVEEGTLSGDDLVRNLVGIVAAWAASVPRSFALSLDALLRRPAELDRVAAAAHAGDEKTVSDLWLEGLRLQPQAAFLVRRCKGEVVVAPGARREHHIRPGDVVLAVTASGMRDEHALDMPDGLMAGRGDEEYLHYGAGIHTCFGEHISRRQFGALGTALLQAGPVKPAGRLRWEGSFPHALPVGR